MKQFASLSEASRKIGVTRQAVAGYLKSGRLTGKKVAREWRINRASLNSFERPGIGRTPTKAKNAKVVAEAQSAAKRPYRRKRAYVRRQEPTAAATNGQLSSNITLNLSKLVVSVPELADTGSAVRQIVTAIVNAAHDVMDRLQAIEVAITETARMREAGEPQLGGPAMPRELQPA